MNWYKIAAKKEFDLSGESRDLWRIFLLREMDRVGIHFDTENDDVISSRTIDCDIKQDKNSDQSHRAFCEMRIASGDWQCPNIYFRCQMMYKYDSINRWNHGYKFIFIPSKNLNLAKNDSGVWLAKNENDHECQNIEDAVKKDFWDMLKKEVEKRRRDELKMYENSDNHDDDVWDVGFARDLLKHWKPRETT